MRSLLPRLAAPAVFLLACGGIAAGLTSPVPYVVQEAGPVEDTLGHNGDGDPLIAVSGHETYPTEGELNLTTVSVRGTPQRGLMPFQVVGAWFDRERTVLPVEAVYPEGISLEESRLQSRAEMTTSQQSAIAAALTELGIDYENRVVVHGVAEDAPAQDVVHAGDILTAVDGTAYPTVADYAAAIAGTEPGTTVELTLVRDGETITVDAPTQEVDGRARIGVVLSTAYEFPFDVSIELENIGGPSAGAVFALGIYDTLTPGALTGGEDIAGTGTITAAGEIGPIGGIRQKLVGAAEEGSDFFLAPAGNCAEVTGQVPDGLEVVRVETLEDAIAAVETIGETGSAEHLPSCEDSA